MKLDATELKMLKATLHTRDELQDVCHTLNTLADKVSKLRQELISEYNILEFDTHLRQITISIISASHNALMYDTALTKVSDELSDKLLTELSQSIE